MPEGTDRPTRGLRRGAALLTLALVTGVSALAWEDPDEASVESLGNGTTWAIWTGAALLACGVAAVIFRRDRELRIGVLQGLALAVVAAVAVLWIGIAA